MSDARIGLSNAALERIRRHVDRRLAKVKPAGTPRISDISLREKYILVTINNISNLSVDALVKEFGESRIYFVEQNNDTFSIRIYVPRRFARDYLSLFLCTFLFFVGLLAVKLILTK